MRVAVGPVERDYAVLVLTSLDGQAIESAKRALLTAVGSAENHGMSWNATRTSVTNQWGTGPAEVNGIAAEITLPRRVAKVFALDGRGQRLREVPVTAADGGVRFSIGPEHRTLWYEIDWRFENWMVGG